MPPALRAAIHHRKIYHICRRQMIIPPRQICHICRRLMSLPLAKSMTPALRAFLPHLHLWRGGGRQAGGEVKRAGDEVKNEKRPKLNSFDHFLKKTREK